MTEDGSQPVSRRNFMRAVAGGVAATATASGAAAAQGDGLSGWFGDDARGGATDNFDGVVDRTGRASTTVEVGADGNGGTFAFAPAAIRVAPGTEVTFEWVSNTHNVVVEEQPGGASWAGHEPIENEGFSFAHTFETEGIYKYYCQPHVSRGMKGAIVVGDVDVGGGTPGAGGTATPAGGNGTATPAGGGGGGTAEVVVGPGGDLVFEPGTEQPLEIAPGTTVRWVWDSDTHNVVVESQPEDASWPGHEPIENAGFEYTYTFEVLGEYHYYCQPHRAQGMVADLIVTENPATPTPEPEFESALPDGAKALGVAAAATMVSTLALTYAFIKYGGSSPPEAEE